MRWTGPEAELGYRHFIVSAPNRKPDYRAHLTKVPSIGNPRWE
jgi:hypothetical protein